MSETYGDDSIHAEACYFDGECDKAPVCNPGIIKEVQRAPRCSVGTGGNFSGEDIIHNVY